MLSNYLQSSNGSSDIIFVGVDVGSSETTQMVHSGQVAPNLIRVKVPAYQIHVTTFLTRDTVLISVYVDSYPLYAVHLDLLAYWAKIWSI